MTPLELEKREHDRELVLEYQRKADECAQAYIHFSDNVFLKAAMEVSITRAAKLHARFLRKYREQPLLTVQLENEVEGV